MTEEINYKEFADRFYNLLKENHFYRGVPAFNEVVKDYENATKPKMNIANGYRGCSAEDIMRMPEQELREAVIRAFSVECSPSSETDSYFGTFLLSDKVADAFRGRV